MRAYRRLLSEGFDTILNFPELGKVWPESTARYRKIASHLVFYRAEADKILILRILHERMDVREHLAPFE